MDSVPLSPRRRSSKALEATLTGIAQALDRGLFAEKLSHQPGLFQALDARVKVISVLLVLIGISAARSLGVIVALYVLALLVGLRSGLSVRLMVGRVWLALPFFTGIIALPALFLTPGPRLLELPLGLIVTRTGLNTTLFLLLRISASLSWSTLLVLTTPWNTVLSALSVLRVPDVVLIILGMTYRYIYLLLHVANDMLLSRKSRTVGAASAAQDQGMVAAVAGTLLGKSLALSSEVYLAMQSRGFRGSVITLKSFRMQTRDWLWLALLMAVAFGFIIWEH